MNPTLANVLQTSALAFVAGFSLAHIIGGMEVARRPYKIVERHGPVIAVEDEHGRMFFMEKDGTLTPFDYRRPDPE